MTATKNICQTFCFVSSLYFLCLVVRLPGGVRGEAISGRIQRTQGATNACQATLLNILVKPSSSWISSRYKRLTQLPTHLIQHLDDLVVGIKVKQVIQLDT